MPIYTVVKDPSKLSQVVDILHDRWFDLDQVLFDPQDCVLTIPFSNESIPGSRRIRWSDFFSRAPGQGFECFLRIANVESYSVVDTEKVRFYDLNELTYEPEAKRIRITAGVPLQMTVTVKDLDVSVEQAVSR